MCVCTYRERESARARRPRHPCATLFLLEKWRVYVCVCVCVCVQRESALPETSLCTRLVLNPSMEVAGNIYMFVCAYCIFIYIERASPETFTSNVISPLEVAGVHVYVYTFIWRDGESERHLRYPCAT